MNSSRLTHAMSSSEGMSQIFSPVNTVQRMLDVEAALAQALAAEGVIPQDASQDIVEACVAANIDLNALARDAGDAGNLAIPLLRQLTAQVAARNCSTTPVSITS